MKTQDKIKVELSTEFHNTCWELVQHQPNLQEPAVRQMFLMAKERWIGSILPTTQQAFKRWVDLLSLHVSAMNVPWKEPLLELCKRIINGEFSGRGSHKEYKYTYNRKVKDGYLGNSSAAGGLMSLFYQAMSYDNRALTGRDTVFPPLKAHKFRASETFIMVDDKGIKKRNGAFFNVRIDNKGDGGFSAYHGPLNVEPIVLQEFDTIQREGTPKVWRVRIERVMGSVFFQEVGTEL